MQPDSTADLRRALAGVVRRTWFAHLMSASALSIAAVAALFAMDANAVPAMLVGGAGAAVMIAVRRRERTRAHAATLIERAVPASRNVVVTAEELLVHPERASDRMREVVFDRAARHAVSMRLPAARSLKVPGLFLVAALCGVAIAIAIPRTVAGPASAIGGGASASADKAVSLVVAVDPPRYTGRAATREIDPSRVEAFEGSTLHLAIEGPSSGWRLRFGSQPISLDGGPASTLLLISSGYLALEPPRGSGARARLIPVNVSPDRAPSVRIDTPARDLLMPDATGRIAVTASATDDIGVEALEVRYTKVSGTGEDFEFVEGTLPVSLTRSNARTWSAAAEIALGPLQLEPGDSLVYRAVARDGRPGGAGESSSDTFFVEIAGPGQIALEGFALPPEQERYALSQQMIVLKIERLRAREKSLPRPALKESAAAIAAEQRAVRANFIFLMGGHVEDEEVEAEQSNEIQEGRLENTARREISSAIHLMTRAEQGLVAINTATALPPARQAVEALQRAFGRNRYILRTPPSRAEIDPSRRLSGAPGGASSWRRALVDAPRDQKASRAEAFVEAALSASGQMSAGISADPRSIQALAEQALAVDPAAREWQQIAARLSDVAALASKGPGATGILAAFAAAVRPALALAGEGGVVAPAGTARQRALPRAWSGEARR